MKQQAGPNCYPLGHYWISKFNYKSISLSNKYKYVQQTDVEMYLGKTVEYAWVGT